VLDLGCGVARHARLFAELEKAMTVSRRQRA
jgi:hypothetical protein